MKKIRKFYTNNIVKNPYVKKIRRLSLSRIFRDYRWFFVFGKGLLLGAGVVSGGLLLVYSVFALPFYATYEKIIVVVFTIFVLVRIATKRRQTFLEILRDKDYLYLSTIPATFVLLLSLYFDWLVKPKDLGFLALREDVVGILRMPIMYVLTVMFWLRLIALPRDLIFKISRIKDYYYKQNRKRKDLIDMLLIIPVFILSIPLVMSIFMKKSWFGVSTQEVMNIVADTLTPIIFGAPIYFFYEAIINDDLGNLREEYNKRVLDKTSVSSKRSEA